MQEHLEQLGADQTEWESHCATLATRQDQADMATKEVAEAAASAMHAAHAAEKEAAACRGSREKTAAAVAGAVGVAASAEQAARAAGEEVAACRASTAAAVAGGVEAAATAEAAAGEEFAACWASADETAAAVAVAAGAVVAAERRVGEIRQMVLDSQAAAADGEAFEELLVGLKTRHAETEGRHDELHKKLGELQEAMDPLMAGLPEVARAGEAGAARLVQVEAQLDALRRLVHPAVSLAEAADTAAADAAARTDEVAMQLGDLRAVVSRPAPSAMHDGSVHCLSSALSVNTLFFNRWRSSCWRSTESAGEAPAWGTSHAQRLRPPPQSSQPQPATLAPRRV